MCGPSQEQQELSQEQMDFYTALNDQYSAIFAQSQAITSALTSAFTPILQAGPSQTGFSAGEENALSTQNTQNVATDYAQAQKATAGILAARGGGNTMLPSSVTSNILASNTNAAAAQRAQGQNTITQANYAQGYQNWQQAAGVLSSTAGLLNPNAYASSATTAGGAAGTTFNQIAQEQFAPYGAVIGAAGSIAGAALSPGGAATKILSGAATGGGFAGLPACWIAAEIYGGWYEPRTVLVRKWLLENFTGHWLLDLYIRFGQRVAAMVRKYRPMRWIFTRIFNQFLRQARAAS